MTSRLLPLLIALLLTTFAAACADEGPEVEGAYLDHEEMADFDVPTGLVNKRDIGVPATFDRHDIMSDAFFTNVDAIDADGLQRFFEQTPYGSRSWLASAQIGGVPASQALVTASRAAGINPIVMLARMQVESSLVARTTNPGSAADYAFGCGCPDRQGCSTRFRGLDKQVQCAGDTLHRWYVGSQDGTGSWRLGVAKRTLDPLTVTPSGHATASLYAYTPWVLQGRGGNWLVWNVTRKYALAFEARGDLHDPGQPVVTPDVTPDVTTDVTPVGGMASMRVGWSFRSDGRTADFAVSAPGEVQRVEYFVDGYNIGAARRSSGANFALGYRFNTQKADRELDVLGFDAAGAQVAMATGKIDSDGGTNIFIRQMGDRTFEMGIETPPAGVAFVEVRVDGVLLVDGVTGQSRTSRKAVSSTLNQVGMRRFELSTYNANGTYRGTLSRDFEVW